MGDDGQTLVAELEEAGVSSDGVTRVDTASGHAVIQVDSSGQNAIVIFSWSQSADSSATDRAISVLKPGDWLLLQNETNDIAAMLTQAAAKEASVAINLAPADDRIHEYPLQLAKLLIVNEVEAMALAKCSDLSQAWVALRDRFPGTDLVLTLGVKVFGAFNEDQ